MLCVPAEISHSNLMSSIFSQVQGNWTHSLSEYRVIRLLTTRIIHQGYSDSVYKQNAWTEKRNIVYKP